MRRARKKLIAFLLAASVTFTMTGVTALATEETRETAEIAEEPVMPDNPAPMVDEVNTGNVLETEGEETSSVMDESAVEIPEEDNSENSVSDSKTEVKHDVTESEAVSPSLVDQTLTAVIQSGSSGIAAGSASTQITLSGVMPEDAFVTAEAVDIDIEGIRVLAAYDITIYDADGGVYQPQAGAVQVHIANSEIRSAETAAADLVIYHMKDVNAPPEQIPVSMADGGAVEFEAESFSIYVVGEDDASLTDLADDSEHYYYTVTFFVQNDSGEYVVDSGPLRVSPDEALDEPGVPDIEGHTFVGWCTQKDGGRLFTFKNGGKMPEITDNTNHILNLYAHYAETHYVYYHTRPFAETSETHPDIVFHIDTYLSEENILDTADATELYIKEGYLTGTEALIAWTDEKGEVISDGTTVDTDLELYPSLADALWVYFDMNGKDATVTPMFVYGDAETIEDLPSDVDCAGYIFDGWYMNAECEGEQVTDETPISSIASRNTDGSITLYAKWLEDHVHYTVNIWRQKATDGSLGLEQKIFKIGEQYSVYSAYYDFAESIEISAENSTLKSGEEIDMEVLSDYIEKDGCDPSSSNPYNGFEYNQYRTENELAGKTAAPDGSTVVNVYYDRVTITWHFFNSNSKKTDINDSSYEGSLIGLYGTNLTPKNESDPGGTLDDIPSHHRRYTFQGTNDRERVTGMENKFILREADEPATIYYWLRANGIYTAYISYFLEWDEERVPDGATTRTAFGKTYMLVDSVDYNYTTASATHYYRLYDEYDGYKVAGYNLGTYNFWTGNLKMDSDTFATVDTDVRLQSTYTTKGGSNALYIYFDKKEYTVTLGSNAKVISLGSGDTPYYNASAEYTRKYAYGDPIKFNLPTPENLDGVTFGPTTNGAYYEFTGKWYADPTLEVELDWSQYKTMPACNLVAFAGWRLKDVTVTFDSNGGSEVPVQNIKATEKALEPEDPVKDGYNFVGWQDVSTGRFFSFSTVLYENIILSAVWQAEDTESYPLIYDLNLNGIGQDTYQRDEEYVIGSDVGVIGILKAFPDLDEAQKTKFICWNTAADGSGTNYYPDEIYKITGVIDILYARWSIEQRSTLKLDHNYPSGYTHGSEINDVDTVTQHNLTDINLEETSGLEHGATIILGTTTYRFGGWSRKKTDAGRASDGDVEICASTTVAVDTVNEEAVNTLYAVWVRLDPVTVTKIVDSNGVSGFDPNGETFRFTYSVDDADDDYDIINGTASVDTFEKQDDDSWRATFLIPDVATGAKVTVTESGVDEKYSTSLFSNSETTGNGDNSIAIIMPGMEATISVINSLEVTNLTIEKIWNDGGSTDRPEEVVMTLLDGDGEITTFAMTAGDVDEKDEDLWTSVIAVPADESAEYRLVEKEISGYTCSVVENKNENQEITGFTVSNTLVRTITVTKLWQDSETEHENVTVTLTGTDGETTFTETEYFVDTCTFCVPVYSSLGETYGYSASETPVSGYIASYSSDNYKDGTVGDTGELTITNTKLYDGGGDADPGTLTVNKIWVDGKTDHSGDSVFVQLNADGDAINDKVLILSDSNSWSGSFTDLPGYNMEEEITYTVEETGVPAGYKVSCSDLENGVITITNTELYDGGEGTNPGEIKVNIEWDDADDHDGRRPDLVTVQLLADDNTVAETDITKNNSQTPSTDDGIWTATFTDMPRCNDDGTEIVYTVTETVPDAYKVVYDKNDELKEAASVISGAAWITNVYEPETTDLTVTVVWKDSFNNAEERPDHITVSMLADGTVLEGKKGTLSLTPDDEDANGNWVYTVRELPLYSNGKMITYSAIESEIPHYLIEADDMEINNDGSRSVRITNYYVNEYTDITVTKEWDDSDDKDGIRPDSIRVILSDQEMFEYEAVMTESDGWAYTYTDIPADLDGKILIYTLTEKTVRGYESKIEETEDSFKVTNIHTSDSSEEGGADIPDPGNSDAEGHDTDSPDMGRHDTDSSNEETLSEVDKSRLQELYDELGRLSPSDLTSDDWKRLQNGLAAAKAVLDDPDATQEEVDAAYRMLLALYDELMSNTSIASAKTGDNNVMILCILLIIAAGAAIVIISVGRRMTRR